MTRSRSRCLHDLAWIFITNTAASARRSFRMSSGGGPNCLPALAAAACSRKRPKPKKFCLHLVAEFESSPSDELHLVLLMKDIRRTLVSYRA